jgi:hypothetical protein
MGSLAWPLAAPAQQASVPAAAPVAQASGGDPIVSELVKNISSPLDSGLVKAAMAPVAGAHTAQLPSSLQRPIGSYQERPMNNNPVVGHKQGRLQGIGNAITGATNAIGTVMNKEAQMKQDTLRDQATKVIMAQQGIDEAKAAHDAAIKNNDAAAASQAQELIQKNTQARDAVFADPKTRKALAKGFDISYTDPSANKTEEHAAVQAAMKQAKTLQEKRQIMQQAQAQQNAAAGQAAGAAYEKAQPQGMAPNTQAQQQLQLAQAQKVQQQTVLKDYLTYKSAVMRTNATIDAAKIREQGALMMEQSRIQAQQDALKQRFQNEQTMQGIKYSDDVKLVGVRAAAAQQTAMAIYRDKESDPLTIYNKTRTAAETYAKSQVANIKTLNDLQKQRDGFFLDAKGQKLKQPADQYEVDNLDKQIAIVHDQVLADKASAENFTKQANTMKDNFGFGEGDPNAETDSTSGGARSTDDSAGASYADPGFYDTLQ